MRKDLDLNLNANTMRRAGLILCVLSTFVSSHAHALWDDAITSHIWDNTDLNQSGNGTDCGANVADGYDTPGRPPGGWFEWRFASWPFGLNPSGQFISAAGPTGWQLTPDVTRFCPRSFSETNMSHAHGVRSARLALHKGTVYAVYDQASGYYGQNRIHLQQDPSNAVTPQGLLPGLTYPLASPPTGPVNNMRPYTIIDIARNPRQYVNLNPGSADYIMNLGGAGSDCAVGATQQANGTWVKSGFQVDKDWATHSGIDHEGTRCGAPGQVDTADPDIDIRSADVDANTCATGGGGRAVVAWVERVVEGSKVNAGPSATVTLGFDPAFPIASSPIAASAMGLSAASGGPPNWFPYRGYRVHVEDFCPNDLAAGRDSTASGRIAHTALTDGNGFGGSDEATNAISPRVTQVKVGTAFKPVVVWAQAAFSKLSPNEVGGVEWGVPPQTPGDLYARQWSAGTTWDPRTSIGTVCNVQEVSSGKATGRRRLFTGTHDVATVVDTNGVERPIVVMTELVGATCQLSVKQYNGANWVALGGDLRVNTAATVKPAWPRITVHKNIPYITWTERDGDAPSNVYVKRLRSDQTLPLAWDSLGGAWNFNNSADGVDRVRGPSIVVANLSSPATTGDDGAAVFVSMQHHEPGSLNNNGAAAGPWGAMVFRCLTHVNAGVWSCMGSPDPWINKVRNPQDSSKLSVYDDTGHLGATWGSAVSGTADPVDNVPTGLAQNQTVGYAVDSAPAAATGVFRFHMPGATDLVLDAVTQSGQPDGMYLGFPAFTQDHRNADVSLVVRKDMPLNSQRASIALGDGFTVATAGVRSSDVASWGVFTWGKNNLGQLGLGHANATRVVGSVSGFGGAYVTKVAASATFAAALTAAGKIYMWGDNTLDVMRCSGATVFPVTAPRIVPGTDVWVDVAVGAAHIAALRNDGTVWTCGNNATGQLGDNTLVTKTTFVQAKTATLSPLTNVRTLAAGGNFNCVIRQTGIVWCWGQNAQGQLGRNTVTASETTAAAVFNDLRAVKISLGFGHAAAVTVPGTVYAWGLNVDGQLGLNTNTNVSAPQSTNQAAEDVFATKANTYIRTATNTLMATGKDASGQMGEGSTFNNRQSFVAIGVGLNMGAGTTAEHAYAVDSPGLNRTNQAWSCWGKNTNGECGDGTLTNRFTPVAAATPSRYGCAASVTGYDFFGGDNYAVGCGGSVTRANRDNLCAPGFSACLATQWQAVNGLHAPTAHYWTAGTLFLQSPGTASCTASTVSSSTAFARVCASSSADSFGNGCIYSNCDYLSVSISTNGYFGGGVAANPTAGTLCCKQ